MTLSPLSEDDKLEMDTLDLRAAEVMSEQRNARTLIDVGGITRTSKKEYEHLTGNKEMEWDVHFNNLTALVRFSGVGGALSRSTSPVLSSYGALTLSAATGANITRTSKDLLTHAFQTPKPDKKKKRKKKPDNKKFGT